MSFFFVDPEIYKRYKDEVLSLSDSVQINFQEQLPPEERRRGLSDREIAEKLGLDERTVREIRVVAERDTYDLSEWEKAIEFKDKACRAFARHGISYVFKHRNEIK
jgi:ribosome-binding protein aMBF1 (putative translation factor)